MTKKHQQGDAAGPSSRGRRQFMFGTAAAGIGLAAGMIADAAPAEADDGDALQLGLGNVASAVTTLTTSDGTALRVRTTGKGDSGIEGIDASPDGSGIGVFGTSPKGHGVYGVAVTGYGLYGNSSSGNGVSGNSDSGDGVTGNSNNGFGVVGTARGAVSDSNYGQVGVYGIYTGTDKDLEGHGVYAVSLNGPALFANGDAQVTGTLSKGGGSFKIDHPLDPAHKYLYHSFVESPDMKNVYDGTVTLDGDGRATVELPDWFETLNRDFRYQLTAIGAAAPELHIAAKVFAGTFAIAGGKPGLEVSWQVTGIRQDTWANANRIPVEVDKPVYDRGRYLHPDLYENGNGEPIDALLVGRRHIQPFRTGAHPTR